MFPLADFPYTYIYIIYIYPHRVIHISGNSCLGVSNLPDSVSRTQHGRTRHDRPQTSKVFDVKYHSCSQDFHLRMLERRAFAAAREKAKGSQARSKLYTNSTPSPGLRWNHVRQRRRNWRWRNRNQVTTDSINMSGLDKNGHFPGKRHNQ